MELVRSIFAARERGDFSDSGWAHPEIEFVIVDGPAPGSWMGLAPAAERLHDALSAWEVVRAEIDDYRELDNERVLVFERRSGRGKTSGLEVEQMQIRGAHLFHVRGGKVTRLVHYWYRERALADLGLAPEGDSPGS